MKSRKRQLFELLVMLSAGIALLVVVQNYESEQYSQRTVSPKSNAVASNPARAMLGQVEKRRRPKSGQLELYKKGKASSGFTLIAAAGSERAELISLEGEVVHHWDLDIERARLLENCNLLVLHGSKWGLANQPWKRLSRSVREYDWDGNLVWEYVPPSKPHHDTHRLPNGNTLFLRHLALPADLRSTLKDPVKRAARVMSDGIMEVDASGQVVWDWRFFDHFPLDSCGPRDCPLLKREIDEEKRFKFDWTHMNTAAPLPANKWFDQGDQRFRPGNILILPRNWSTVYLVDKTSGKSVWEFRGDYKGGLHSGHESHMIPRGLPGAGNVLIFDNGIKPGVKGIKASSRILEIEPTTKKLVWVYDQGKEFFSKAAGSVQRLPNGNTLISEDVPGRVFEVTPQKEIVWQYQSPARTSRSQRYSSQYCEKLEQLSQRAYLDPIQPST